MTRGKSRTRSMVAWIVGIAVYRVELILKYGSRKQPIEIGTTTRIDLRANLTSC